MVTVGTSGLSGVCLHYCLINIHINIHIIYLDSPLSGLFTKVSMSRNNESLTVVCFVLYRFNQCLVTAIPVNYRNKFLI